MKKYFLTKDLVKELIYGKKERKEKISSTLETLMQKNELLCISINSLNKILEEEPNLEKRLTIHRNLVLLSEKILSVNTDDLPLAIGFETEFKVDHFTATELVAAKKSEIDYILDISDNFKFQKMISVINLILKTE